MVGRFGSIFSSVYISEHQEVTDVIGRGRGKTPHQRKWGLFSRASGSGVRNAQGGGRCWHRRAEDVEQTLM